MDTEDFVDLQEEFFFYRKRKSIFDLQEEFFSIARANLAPDDEEAFSDVIEEARWQVNDWYNGCSYYPKPEDILQDFFFLTPEQAHRFLPIFKSEEE